MITTMLHWLIKELIKGILQMLLLLLISWLHFLASCLSEVLPNPNIDCSANDPASKCKRLAQEKNQFFLREILSLNNSVTGIDTYCLGNILELRINVPKNKS